MQNDAHNFLSFRAFVHVQRSVEIFDERRITCNKIPSVSSQSFSFLKSTSSRQSVIFFTGQSHIFLYVTDSGDYHVGYSIHSSQSAYQHA